MADRFLIIGNPENRRVSLFQTALARCGLPEARCISYESLLSGDADFSPAPDEVVRLESPGENESVSRSLICRGAILENRDVEEVSRIAADARHGEIVFPGLWFRGYANLLSTLAGCRARWMSHPSEIAVQFDKARCQRLLSDAGVPAPQQLGPVSGYEELRDRMKAAGCSRVFVKLNSSSSASGVVALQTARGQIRATTTTQIDSSHPRLRLFNSLKLNHYSDEATVAQLIDALADHGVTVERWLPKAGWDNRVFDLRVVMIAGEARHTVVRMSQQPLTNLHLGNERASLAELRERVPPDSLDAAFESCRLSASQFSGTHYCGLDLMFTPGFRRHAILEVNAFGDLLPGVTSRGEDTYSAEILAWLRTRRPTLIPT